MSINKPVHPFDVLVSTAVLVGIPVLTLAASLLAVAGFLWVLLITGVVYPILGWVSLGDAMNKFGSSLGTFLWIMVLMAIGFAHIANRNKRASARVTAPPASKKRKAAM